jgi:dihydrodipicolinate synthase/N-acetylneuraminate lyase
VQKRKQWAEAILAYGKNKLPIFIHVGYNKNLDDSVELASHAEKHGAFAVASVGIGAQASLDDNIAYFKRLSAAAPNTPFYIYWVAQGTTLTGGKGITAHELLTKMEQVPTFAGIKFTDSNFYMLERFKKYRPDINILTGVEQMAMCGQLMGADGNIGAEQAVTPYHFKLMWEKTLAGKIDEVKELQFRANHVCEFWDKPGVGSLPGIKVLFDKIYGIPAGYASPKGPFGAKLPSKEDTDTLVKTFEKNIATLTY